MIKKVAIGSVATLLVGSFFFGRDVFSYIATGADSVRNAVLSEVPNAGVVAFLLEQQTQFMLVHMLRTAQGHVCVVEFLSDAADVVVIHAVLLDADTAASDAAKMTKRLNHDHALAPFSGSQSGSDATGRSAINANVCLVDFGLGLQVGCEGTERCESE